MEYIKPKIMEVKLMASGDKEFATKQLELFAETHRSQPTPVLTSSTGCQLGNKLASLTVGPKGPILLQDFALIDELAHFDREKIPERVVHAKGTGAFGYFEVTHDVTKYTKAVVFSKIGKQTPIAVRFSMLSGETGSPDTVRDVRGFAVKFYSEDGNWDLVGNNTPIFFVRDPIHFASLSHSRMRNPATSLKDPNMFWDLVGHRPETTHQVSLLYGDRGIPDGYRFMNGHGINTFKLVNSDMEAVYCKFHYTSNQGLRNLDPATAHRLVADDPDYANRDLFNAISAGEYPSWTLKIQVMTFDQAEKSPFDPFDATKVWPESEFPMIDVGKLVLDRNPRNFFAEMEQIAFCPSNMIPGIEPSPDRILQARLFSYSDTQRHRLGANFLQLPVNCPLGKRVMNYQKEGPMAVQEDFEGYPKYYPNSFGGPVHEPSALESKFYISGDVSRYDNGDQDNYGQVQVWWKDVLSEEERERVVQNVACHLKLTLPLVQDRVIKNLSLVDSDYGRRVKEAIDKSPKV